MLGTRAVPYWLSKSSKYVDFCDSLGLRETKHVTSDKYACGFRISSWFDIVHPKHVSSNPRCSGYLLCFRSRWIRLSGHQRRVGGLTGSRSNLGVSLPKIGSLWHVMTSNPLKLIIVAPKKKTIARNWWNPDGGLTKAYHSCLNFVSEGILSIYIICPSFSTSYLLHPILCISNLVYLIYTLV